METIRRKLFLLLGGILVVTLFAFASLWFRWDGKHKIAVGGKAGEGEILSEILAQHIENTLGIPVKRKCRLDGTFILFQALKDRQIDLYVEYTGTALTAILGENVRGLSRVGVYEAVKEGLMKWDIQTLSPLGFESKYALMMDPIVADTYGIQTLSDLALKGSSLTVRFDPEFCAREEFQILKNEYLVPLENLKMMDHVLLYLALGRKSCDLIDGYSTDGFCKGLRLLEDDQERFPAYEAVPIARKEILEKIDGLEKALAMLSGKISSEAMQEMNYQVEKNGETAYTVAETFLKNIQR